jgi:hypothetical protein
MNKNKYFNTGRFARLLRNDLLINQKTYLFTLAGFGLAVYSFTYLVMRGAVNGSFARAEDYLPLIFIYLMALGVVIGNAFPFLTNTVKTSNYLLAPGSTFEKYLVQFTIRIALFIPLALIIFWVGIHLAKASLTPNLSTYFDPSKITDFSFSDLFEQVPKFRDKLMIVLSIFSVTSVLFAGSVYFNRFALVKTLIVAGMTIGAVVLSFVLFSHIFYPAENHGFSVELKPYKITDDLYNTQLAVYLLGGLSWIFFLVLGYFKLKEKEV